MERPFAVKSTTNSWHLYNAFAEELKAMGYKHASHFTEFTPSELKRSNCIYISNNWDSIPYPPSFAFSSTLGNAILLESEWEKAIETAKKFIDSIKSISTFQLTKDYSAEIDYNKEVIKVGCQEISFDKVNELAKQINKYK